MPNSALEDGTEGAELVQNILVAYIEWNIVDKDVRVESLFHLLRNWRQGISNVASKLVLFATDVLVDNQDISIGKWFLVHLLYCLGSVSWLLEAHKAERCSIRDLIQRDESGLNFAICFEHFLQFFFCGIDVEIAHV